MSFPIPLVQKRENPQRITGVIVQNLIARFWLTVFNVHVVVALFSLGEAHVETYKQIAIHNHHIHKNHKKQYQQLRLIIAYCYGIVSFVFY